MFFHTSKISKNEFFSPTHLVDEKVIMSDKIISQLRELRLNKEGYLPFEQDSAVPKTVLKSIWRIGMIKRVLGVKDEAEARNWFAKNPHTDKILAHFTTKIEEAFDTMRTEAESLLARQKEASEELLRQDDAETLKTDFSLSPLSTSPQALKLPLSPAYEDLNME